MAVALEGVSVWVADASGTVGLTRLAGPTSGVVRPPVHLIPEELGPDWTCDLDSPMQRARLYAECLRRGGVFDVCRWLDLGALLEVWPLLDLPVGVAGPWLQAFRQAGLEPQLPAESVEVVAEPLAIDVPAAETVEVPVADVAGVHAVPAPAAPSDIERFDPVGGGQLITMILPDARYS